MKAIYKQHQGFEHINNYSINNNDNSMQYEDTSTKKYPNNKYYQFQDEDSSGRKFIKEELNLSYEKQRRRNGYVSFIERELNEKVKINDLSIVQNEKYFKPKENFKNNSHKFGKSQEKSKCKVKKVNKSVNVLKNGTKSNTLSSRNNDIFDNAEEQVKHYRNLCAEIRKKNYELTKQLEQCKEQNRKSISELSQKVQKLNVKYDEKKQNRDNNKNQKIMQSLKSIKGKLSKKQSSLVKQQKRFYDFFVQSLGILQQEGDTVPKYSNLQVQMIWKKMLQFLIAHQFKINDSPKVKTIR